MIPSTERALEAKETICSITESFTVKKLAILQHKYGTVGEVFNIQIIPILHLLMIYGANFKILSNAYEYTQNYA